MSPQHKIKQLVGLGKSQDAIRLLLETTDPNHPTFNDVILLSSNYHTLIGEFAEGIISTEQKQIGLNKINKRLLTLADQLKESVAAPTAAQDTQDVPTPASASEPEKSKIEIRIDKPFDRYSEGEKKNLFSALENLLRLPQTSVTILSVAAGSIIYTLEMPSLYALKLYWLIQLGAMEEMQVIEAKLLGNALERLMPIAPLTAAGGAIWAKLKYGLLGLLIASGILLGLWYHNAEQQLAEQSTIEIESDTDADREPSSSNLQDTMQEEAVMHEEEETGSTLAPSTPVDQISSEAIQAPADTNTEVKEDHDPFGENNPWSDFFSEKGLSSQKESIAKKDPIAAKYAKAIKQKFSNKTKYTVTVRGTDKAEKKYHAVGEAVFYFSRKFKAEYSFKVFAPENRSTRYFYRTTFLFKNKKGEVIYTLTTPMFLIDYEYRKKMPTETFETMLPPEVVVGTHHIAYDEENSSSENKSVPPKVLDLIELAILNNKSISRISGSQLSNGYEAQIAPIQEEIAQLSEQITNLEKAIRAHRQEIDDIRKEDRKNHTAANKSKKKKDRTLYKPSASAKRKMDGLKAEIEQKRQSAESLKQERKGKSNTIYQIKADQQEATAYIGWYNENMREKKVPNDELLEEIRRDVAKNGTTLNNIIQALIEK